MQLLSLKSLLSLLSSFIARCLACIAFAVMPIGLNLFAAGNKLCLRSLGCALVPIGVLGLFVPGPSLVLGAFIVFVPLI